MYSILIHRHESSLSRLDTGTDGLTNILLRI